MVGQPFELQGDAAQHLGTQRTARARPAPRSRWQYAVAWPTEVSPASVSMRWMVRLSGPPIKRSLDSAMLVAERDLQVEDVLAVALEAEVARLDDAGVNRADGDLVDLLAFDPEEVSRRRSAGSARPRRRPPGVVAGAVGAMKPDRLEPGMPLGNDPPLLGDLALEPVRLRAVRASALDSGPPTSVSSTTDARRDRRAEHGVQSDRSSALSGRPKRASEPGAPRRPRRGSYVAERRPMARAGTVRERNRLVVGEPA